jgi:FMN phosphatase YigB (HAD superfamily)
MAYLRPKKNPTVRINSVAKETWIKFVYFDLDDTLVDTTTAVAAGFRAAVARLEEAGAIPGDDGEAYGFIPGLLESFRSLFTWEILAALLVEFDAEPLENEELLTEAAGVFREELLATIRPFPGVPETLAELGEEGIGCGVLTDGPTDHQLAKLAAAGLDGALEPVIVSGDYPPFTMKPSQLLFGDAVRAVGFEPENIAYVGDRTKDVVGANVAGMVSVRVLQGRANEKPHEPRLAVEKPDYVIENVPALASIIRNV